jgi:hypothetical protein
MTKLLAEPGAVTGSVRWLLRLEGLAVLAAAGAFSLIQPTLAPFALIWGAHVGFDRALGYGLKYPNSFQATHLGPIGKGRAG